jgi:hypothetical protein
MKSELQQEDDVRRAVLVVISDLHYVGIAIYRHETLVYGAEPAIHPTSACREGTLDAGVRRLNS